MDQFTAICETVDRHFNSSVLRFPMFEAFGLISKNISQIECFND